jgi:potassium channel subfamily K
MGRMRRVVARRPSVHQDMSANHGDGESRKTTSTIKRQFYGLTMDIDDANKFEELRRKWETPFLSFCTFCFYFLIGGIFYYNVELWTALDCLYFQTVTMTTVGYGDFAPTSPGSKVFTMIYIFTGIAIVGRTVNGFAEYIIQYAEKKAKRREDKRRKLIERAKKNGDPLPATLLVEKKTVHATELRHYRTKIMTSFGSIFLIIFMGAIFFERNEPDIDFLESLYFCVVTMTTVGYGDTKLTKNSSRAFAVFYILCSCVLVTLAIGNLAGVRIQMIAERKKVKMLSRKLDFNFIRELDTGETGMDKTTFLVAMLVQQELVQKEKDVDPWLKKFDELDKANIGVIDFDDTIADLEKEQRKRMEDLQTLEDAEKSKQQTGHHGHDMLGNLQLGTIFTRKHNESEHVETTDESGESGSERYSEYTSDGESQASVDGSGNNHDDEDELRGLSFSYTENPLHPSHKHYFDQRYGSGDNELNELAEEVGAVDKL